MVEKKKINILDVDEHNINFDRKVSITHFLDQVHNGELEEGEYVLVRGLDKLLLNAEKNGNYNDVENYVSEIVMSNESYVRWEQKNTIFMNVNEIQLADGPEIVLKGVYIDMPKFANRKSLCNISL